MERQQIFTHFASAGCSSPLTAAWKLCSSGAEKRELPITDVDVVFPGRGDDVKPGYSAIMQTVGGGSAKLNTGEIWGAEVLLAVSTSDEVGDGRPPVCNIRVCTAAEAVLMEEAGWEIIKKKNLNEGASGSKLYLALQRRKDRALSSIIVVDMARKENVPIGFDLVQRHCNYSCWRGGHALFLAVKRCAPSREDARLEEIPLLPSVLDSLSLQGRGDLPPHLELFCFPRGAHATHHAQMPVPFFCDFVVNDESLGRLYGTSLCFYEEMNPAEVDELAGQSMVGEDPAAGTAPWWLPKTICLLSKQCCFENTKRVLSYIYR